MKIKPGLITALKIWVVIYPSITGLLYVSGDYLSTFPLYQRTFLLTISLVPWMVFAGIPLVEKSIRWIVAKRKANHGKIEQDSK